MSPLFTHIAVPTTFFEMHVRRHVHTGASNMLR
jgi:hypothetical protein